MDRLHSPKYRPMISWPRAGSGQIAPPIARTRQEWSRTAPQGTPHDRILWGNRITQRLLLEQGGQEIVPAHLVCL